MINAPEILETVLDMAKSRHVEADVILSREQQLGLKADRGDLSEYKVTSSRSVGIRVVQGDHVGTSYSESIQPEHLETMVQTAIENARYAKEDPHEKIRAEKQDITDFTDKVLKTDEATTDDKVELAIRLETGLQGRPISAKAPYNGFTEVNYEVHLANSLGHACSHRERMLSCYTYALLEAEGQQSMHFGYQVGRQFQDLDPSACIEEAYSTAQELLAGAPVSTGSYDVIFSTDCLNDLINAFGMCWSGQSAMKGINPLRDKVGSVVAHADLTITDEPTLEAGFSMRSFDSEGFATKTTPIVASGVLEGLLHNSATASFFGLPNTANASRGTKSALSVSPSHICIATGAQTEVTCQSGEYLELISLQGIHSGANAISGDFSFGASGFLCRDGSRVQPVRGITVAGNFYKMLGEIEAIGDTRHADHGKSFFAPLIRFGGLSVAGN